MAQQVGHTKIRDLFLQLSTIETVHRETILELHQKLSNAKTDPKTFTEKLLPSVLEGGLSTEEYLKLYNPDLQSASDVISLAMSIEAQALDLYERTSQRIKERVAQEALHTISLEEKKHIQQLGKLLDTLL